MKLRLLFFKMPYLLFLDLCDAFGIKRTSSRDVMIREVTKLVETSGPEKVDSFFAKFKDLAYPSELDLMVRATGKKKYGLPNDKDGLFDILAHNIGYVRRDKEIPADPVEEKTEPVKPKTTSAPKEETVKAVKWNWNPAKTIDLFIHMPYTPPQAVADVIDNSLDAKAENVDIYQSLDPKTGERYIIIQDDGKGMTEKELHEQIGIGAEREYEEHELGKFGSGLKLSSLSQAKEVSVFSKTSEDGKIAYRRISVPHIEKTGKMELLENKLSSEGHRDAFERIGMSGAGTIVLWEKMDRRPWREGQRKDRDILTKKLMDLREQLSLIFYRYVSGKNRFKREINIRIHGSPIDELDPFMKNETQEYGTRSRELKIPVHFNNKTYDVPVEFVILPQRSMINDRETYKRLGKIKSHNQSQGIYLFRNERLIMHDDWFRIRSIEDKLKCAKVSIEVPKKLDEYFRIDPTKTDYVLPFEFTEDLKEHMNHSSRHWAVNKKNMNFIERARYRYNDETKAKTSRTSKPTSFTGSVADPVQSEPQPATSTDMPVPKKKKVKKRRSNPVEIEVTSETINPEVIFVTHPPGKTKVHLNTTNDQFDETMDKLKKKLNEL